MIPLWRQLVVLLALASALPGCRCSGTDVLAELMLAHGSVERDYAQRLREWEAATPGAKFRLGDGIRSGGASTATLKLRGNAQLTLTPSSMVRFLSNGEEGFIALDVELGEAVLETHAERVRIQSSFGRVVVEPETKLFMAKSANGLRLAVALGKVTFNDPAGPETQVTAGRGIEVAVGGAVIEEFAAQDAVAPGPSASTAAAGDPDATARIQATTTGDGAQRRAPGATAWERLPAGATELLAGSGVKVGSGTSVELRRGKQRVTLGEGEFVVGAPGGYLVQATRGPVRLASRGATVRVPGGTLTAKGEDTSADVTIGPETSEVRVHLGSVEVAGTTTQEVRAGERGVLARDGAASVQGRGPAPVDLVVDGGATFTVHDPRPPTAIGFEVGSRCEHGAVVKLGGATFTGQSGRPSASFPAGTHAYELRCLTRDGLAPTAAATGTVSVVMDAGQRPISRTAPATQVNTDGRRYTVLYQGRLPQVSVGWATAPAAPAYTLVVTGSAPRTVKTTSPNHTFSSGTLPEGTHGLYFEAATDPPRRSRTTTVAIQFDNATPAASLEGTGEWEAGSRSALQGTALPGWKVYLGDRELPLDAQQRFSTEVTMPADGTSLPVRFEHPGRGVHYYLRRAKR